MFLSKVYFYSSLTILPVNPYKLANSTSSCGTFHAHSPTISVVIKCTMHSSWQVSIKQPRQINIHYLYASHLGPKSKEKSELV